MKTKTLKFVTLVMSVVLVTSMLTGCIFGEDPYKEYTSGYFRYLVDGRGTVVITGFTWLGEQRETIDIPREIDGKLVRYIGCAIESDNRRFEVYCSEKLKKMYVHDNIIVITCFYGKDVDIIFCSLNEEFDSITTDSSYKNIYSYGSMLDTINEKSRLGNCAFPANTVFMNNYSDEINEGYYRLDNIEDGETIPIPPEPVRNGYEFTGWYTETECINLWDFEVSPTIEEDTAFRLYAGWRKK